MKQLSKATWSKGVAIASASTLNLDAATGNVVHVTGTTQINAVTLTGGPIEVIFDSGGLTLAHSATANSMPGAANVVTTAGDRATYFGDGTTVWCLRYTSATLPMTVGDHRVLVNTGGGSGSTNTKIRRFTTILTNFGNAITYADSATLGASFTINAAGLYAMNYVDTCTTGAFGIGISVSSAQPTVAIETITAANRLTMMQGATGVFVSCSCVARCSATDVVRPHTGGATVPANATAGTAFSILRLGP